MSLKEYKRFDIAFMMFLAFVAELLGQYLHLKLPGAGFYLSFSTMIIVITMIRWGVIGASVSLGIVLASIIVTKKIDFLIISIQLISYASAGIIPIIFYKKTVYEIISTTWMFLLYIISTFAIITLSYSLLAMMKGYSFGDIFLLYFNRQLFTLLMSYIVLLMIRHQKELLVDMTIYFNEDKETKK
ncbi:hypothetical protein QBE53_15530 [Vallitaleaceae bacterium 9-2]